MTRRRAEPGAEVALAHSSLGWLAAQLGPRVARIDCAPSGLAGRVGEPVIYDAEVPPAAEAGDLILAIGVSAGSGDAVELVRWAGTREASAAAFKMGGDTPPNLAAAAVEAGVALLALPPETAWDQFYALVRRVLATAAVLPGGEDSAPLGDVFALANAIAAMVGGAVVINDLQLQVIAYSTLDDPIDETRRQSILGHRPPGEVVQRLRDEGVLRDLLHSQEAVRLPVWTGDRPRLGIAVRAGKEALGFLFVAEGKAPLGEGAEATMLEASRIAALHLLRLRSSKDLERRQRTDLLRGVLSGRGSVDLLASRLGLHTTGAFTVVGFEFDSAEDADDPDDEDEQEDARLRRARVRDLVLLQSEALRNRAATVSMGSVIYTLLPGREPLTATRLVGLAEDVIDHAARAHQVIMRAGIGSTVTQLAQVEESRHDADQVLRLLRRGLAGRHVATIDQVRAPAFLLELAELPALRSQLKHGKVAALADHDAGHGTAYVETLRAFLNARDDMTVAAKSIHIHRNTLRYRLQRLCELVELDLDDSTERLVAELHLRMIDEEPT